MDLLANCVILLLKLMLEKETITVWVVMIIYIPYIKTNVLLVQIILIKNKIRLLLANFKC